MRILRISERPSALLSACAQVPADRIRFAAASAAHVNVVGNVAVTGEWGIADAQAQQISMQGQLTQVQGTNGFVVKDYPTALQPVGGVRGIPPRGRPV